MKDFYTIYNMEADEFAQPLPPKRPSWVVLFKALAVFFVITVVVFLISNYRSIKNRVDEKRQGLEFMQIEDEDGDGMDDAWERKNGFSHKNSKDAVEDGDGDLLNNRREFYFGTNPKRSDSDRDGYYDNEEIARGFNPSGIGRIDSDSDGIYDWWENRFGMDKKDPKDAQRDSDGDGLTNLEEFKYRTHPKIVDSDLDNISDSEEVENETNPTGEGKLSDLPWINHNWDRDGDGLEISHESFFGTDKEKKDTDNDGMDDNEELLKGRNPRGAGEIVVELEIPSIELKLPIAWMDGESKEAFLKGLGQGAILYPGNAFPGTRGNAYVFGSSGSYKRDGKRVDGEFKRLSEIKKGDKIIVHIKFSENDVKKVMYQAEFSEEVFPEDLRISRDYEGHELTLGTTWPPGKSRRILMVKALIYSPKHR